MSFRHLSSRLVNFALAILFLSLCAMSTHASLSCSDFKAFFTGELVNGITYHTTPATAGEHPLEWKIRDDFLDGTNSKYYYEEYMLYVNDVELQEEDFDLPDCDDCDILVSTYCCVSHTVTLDYGPNIIRLELRNSGTEPDLSIGLLIYVAEDPDYDAEGATSTQPEDREWYWDETNDIYPQFRIPVEVTITETQLNAVSGVGDFVIENNDYITKATLRLAENFGIRLWKTKQMVYDFRSFKSLEYDSSWDRKSGAGYISSMDDLASADANRIFPALIDGGNYTNGDFETYAEVPPSKAGHWTQTGDTASMSKCKQDNNGAPCTNCGPGEAYAEELYNSNNPDSCRGYFLTSEEGTFTAWNGSNPAARRNVLSSAANLYLDSSTTMAQTELWAKNVSSTDETIFGVTGIGGGAGNSVFLTPGQNWTRFRIITETPITKTYLNTNIYSQSYCDDTKAEDVSDCSSNYKDNDVYIDDVSGWSYDPKWIVHINDTSSANCVSGDCTYRFYLYFDTPNQVPNPFLDLGLQGITVEQSGGNPILATLDNSANNELPFEREFDYWDEYVRSEDSGKISIWPVNEAYEYLGPTSNPRIDSADLALSATNGPNSFASGAMVVYGGSNGTTNLQIIKLVSGLTLQRGFETISWNNAEIFISKPWIQGGTGSSSYGNRFPYLVNEMLVKNDDIDFDRCNNTKIDVLGEIGDTGGDNYLVPLGAREMKKIWVTIKIPEGQTAGTYVGYLKADDGTNESIISIKLTVKDIDISANKPKANTVFPFTRGAYISSGGGIDVTEATYEDAVEMAVEHGITSLRVSEKLYDDWDMALESIDTVDTDELIDEIVSQHSNPARWVWKDNNTWPDTSDDHTLLEVRNLINDDLTWGTDRFNAVFYTSDEAYDMLGCDDLDRMRYAALNIYIVHETVPNDGLGSEALAYITSTIELENHEKILVPRKSCTDRTDCGGSGCDSTSCPDESAANNCRKEENYFYVRLDPDSDGLVLYPIVEEDPAYSFEVRGAYDYHPTTKRTVDTVLAPPKGLGRFDFEFQKTTLKTTGNDKGKYIANSGSLMEDHRFYVYLMSTDVNTTARYYGSYLLWRTDTGLSSDGDSISDGGIGPFTLYEKSGFNDAHQSTTQGYNTSKEFIRYGKFDNGDEDLTNDEYLAGTEQFEAMREGLDDYAIITKAWDEAYNVATGDCATEKQTAFQCIIDRFPFTRFSQNLKPADFSQAREDLFDIIQGTCPGFDSGPYCP